MRAACDCCGLVSADRDGQKSADCVEKSRSFQTARALTAENAFFARSYAKSEPEVLCSK
jgi:hypothetical protein